MIRRGSISLFILFSSLFSLSQTADDIAQDRYWNYRNRFKKYFIRYGTYPGYGIPIYEHDIGKGDNSYYDGAYTTGNGATGGMIKFGDAPEAIGNYLILLSTEYKLLKLEGKDTKGTLNEIYYALNAINRIDESAEYYLSGGSQPVSKNGFLMRDDGPKNFYTEWALQYPGSQDREDQLTYYTGDAHKTNEQANNNVDSRNQMSQDHVVDLFTGFVFLKELVDNIYVKPTSGDQGFYIIDEVKGITSRIMTYITALQPIQQSDFLRAQIHEKIFKQELNQTWLDMGNGCAPGDIRKNWVIIDPVTGKLVEQGPNILMLAYPIATVATRITGTDWNDVGVRRKHVDQFGDGYSCIPYDFTLGLHSSDILADVWNSYPQHPQLFDPNDADPDWNFNVTINGVSTNVKMEYKWLDGLAAGINDAVVRDNAAYMALSAACISNTWSHGHIKQHSTYFGMYNYDLMFSVLNNDSPLDSKAFYESILMSAPCDGPYNYDYPTAGTYDSFWNSSNVWVHPNYFENHPSNDMPAQGDYPGIDYMLLYNMYRLAFYNQIPGKYSEDNSCPCSVNGSIKTLTDPNNLNLLSSGSVNRKFYADKNISSYIKEYINKNLNISNNKSLTNATDLIICNNSIVTIDNGGTLQNQSTNFPDDSIKVFIRNGSEIIVNSGGLLDIKNNTKVIIQKGAFLKASNTNARIIVRSGGKLIVEPGAFLELNNGSKLIVEDGGQVIIQTDLSDPNANINGVLTYNQGAVIQLKGNNAVLELNGRLHIGNNASFGFTYPGSNSGYIKFNRGSGWWNNWEPNNAHITCGTNAKIELLGQSKTDKIVDISQNNVAIPKNLSFFTLTKGLVEFNVEQAKLETDRTTFFSNSTFKGTVFNESGGPTTQGVLMFGQYIFDVKNCDFESLSAGIYGALFYMGTKLTRVKNCNFKNCNDGIFTVGSGCSIANNNFVDNSTAIETSGNVYNSFIKNNTVNATYAPPVIDHSNPLQQTNNVGFFIFGETNAVTEITKNTVNNMSNGLLIGNAGVTVKCNDLQGNMIALLGATNSKTNMSDLLGGGFNNGSNSQEFALFDEANYFEAQNGYNAFDISDQNACSTVYTNPGHVPHATCPVITEGSLVNFTSYNTTTSSPYYHYYEIVAENNFWRPISGVANSNIEDQYNKIYKKGSAGNILNARIDEGTALWDNSMVNCPAEGPVKTHRLVHPLDDDSPSSSITTASFYNQKLQKALRISMNKMDKLENANKVNEAADLLTEILKANYVIPVKNPVDKYLLELAYQKLFTCVAQLTEWHRDSTSFTTPLPAPLQTRFNDLRTIIDLRINRKDLTEPDSKEVNDLVYLDRAMVYRLEEDHLSALRELSVILSNQPKTQHRPLYEHLLCLWSTENDAIKNKITVEEAMERIKACNKNYYPRDTEHTSAERIAQPVTGSKVTYAKEYAIAVYPNPTLGNLTIAYSLQDFNKISFELFDVQGKKMISVLLNPQERNFNIENLNLENGVYFYSITADNKNLMTKKLVVVK